jgi:hypothetical protein
MHERMRHEKFNTQTTANHGDARRYGTNNRPRVDPNSNRIGGRNMSVAPKGTPCGFVVLRGLRVRNFGHDTTRSAPILLLAKKDLTTVVRRFPRISTDQKSVAWRNGRISP